MQVARGRQADCALVRDTTEAITKVAVHYTGWKRNSRTEQNSCVKKNRLGFPLTFIDHVMRPLDKSPYGVPATFRKNYWTSDGYVRHYYIQYMITDPRLPASWVRRGTTSEQSRETQYENPKRGSNMYSIVVNSIIN